MKTPLRNLFTGVGLALTLGLTAQTRYLDEIFSESQITVTSDVVYGINFSFYAPASIGGPQLIPLFCDIYQPDPAQDWTTDRPVLIYFHTGSFLPKGLASPMGEKTDSAAVEICTRFAKKGYVVVSATYRVGWLANSTDLDLRRGTNLLAVYLAIQDAKSAVRFLRKTESADGDPYGIDPNHIGLIGQGSGGYITLAYASIDKLTELTNPTKFQHSVSGTGLYGQPVNAGDPYIDTSIVGDWDGYGAMVTLTGNTTPIGLPEVDQTQPGRNFINHPGYSADVDFVMNMGGALGDSTWLEAGDVPVISLHCRYDFFAPYYRGMVQVPVGGTFYPVVYVNGSHSVSRMSNLFGNNDVFVNANFTDVYTTKALNNPHNLGQQEGVFTFNIPPADPNLPFQINANPWDWWDPADPMGANETNPNIKAQSMLYIDTVVGYSTPRIYEAMGKPIGVKEWQSEEPLARIYPNPAREQLTLEALGAGEEIRSFEILDITGKTVLSGAPVTARHTADISSLHAGLYFVKVNTGGKNQTFKLTVH